jgi:glutamine---fructose-6-phosphate transaminase (isomerizing)
METLVSKVKQLGAECLVVSNDLTLLAAAQLPMPLPIIPEWLSPMVSVLPGQLFGLELARSRGLDPDRPRGLTKITETW